MSLDLSVPIPVLLVYCN